MSRIVFFVRETGELKEEKIYGNFFLKALYSEHWASKGLSSILLPLITKLSFFSKLYAFFQKNFLSRFKIASFVAKFDIDATEFSLPVSAFRSFNDFFIRTLKPTCRPIAHGEKIAVLPADGRYLVFPKISESTGFYVKGQAFDIQRLLDNQKQVETYRNGALVIARLCPTDYHRFHFPCDCTPQETLSIKGPLYSVSPFALRRRMQILTENERKITKLVTKSFGELLFIEVGATFVGTIKQTHQTKKPYLKGEEKGYFEFGGSCILLLFPPDTITFDKDLITSSTKQIETYAKMGQSLGRANEGHGK